MFEGIRALLGPYGSTRKVEVGGCDDIRIDGFSWFEEEHSKHDSKPTHDSNFSAEFHGCGGRTRASGLNGPFGLDMVFSISSALALVTPAITPSSLMN
jgi:hypothetical protein